MRGFDNSEFENRVKKARLLMSKNHIDLLLITSPHNFRYFSGLDSYFWESPTRPWFLLIPIKFWIAFQVLLWVYKMWIGML